MQPDVVQRNNVRIIGLPTAAQSLVFVHGFGTDQRVWESVVEPLLGDYRIVLFDHLGAGGSDPGAWRQDRYLNLHQYAADLAEIRRVAAPQRPVLIGHSVGGMISALACMQQPELASGLVMIGASPRYRNDQQTGYHGGMEPDDIARIYDAATGDFEAWSTGFSKRVMAAPERPQLARVFADSLRSIPRERMLTMLCAILQTDYRSELSTLAKQALPTLIIQTRDDPVVPRAVAEYMHDRLPGSTLRVIDADGHLPHVTAPQQIVDALLDFIRSID